MIQAANISRDFIKGAVVCAALLVTGCADMERGFSDRDMDSFVAAMISIDCKVNFDNHEIVEEATGFTKDKLMAITGYLKDKKLIVETKDTDGITLINEGCP